MLVQIHSDRQTDRQRERERERERGGREKRKRQTEREKREREGRERERNRKEMFKLVKVFKLLSQSKAIRDTIRQRERERG